jgi:glutathione-regulated potassium-efflux system protein KefB
MAIENQDVLKTVVLLAAGVAVVPLFRRIGLGSVLGYLAAGVAIGPFGLAFFLDPQTILHVAELGVVMFLFVIGLEMQPSRLWNMRRQIFGLGLSQVVVCGAALTAAGVFIWGLKPGVALIAGMGFVLSSTAIVMQVLEERGDRIIANRQRVMSVLLLEDLAIVPLLALVAVLSPGPAESGAERLLAIAAGLTPAFWASWR